MFLFFIFYKLFIYILKPLFVFFLIFIICLSSIRSINLLCHAFFLFCYSCCFIVFAKIFLFRLGFLLSVLFLFVWCIFTVLFLLHPFILVHCPLLNIVLFYFLLSLQNEFWIWLIFFVFNSFFSVFNKISLNFCFILHLIVCCVLFLLTLNFPFVYKNPT